MNEPTYEDIERMEQGDDDEEEEEDGPFVLCLHKLVHSSRWFIHRVGFNDSPVVVVCRCRCMMTLL